MGKSYTFQPSNICLVFSRDMSCCSGKVTFNIVSFPPILSLTYSFSCLRKLSLCLPEQMLQPFQGIFFLLLRITSSSMYLPISVYA